MLTSARNQFLGTIKAIHIGAVNAEIEIKLKGGETIIASITKDSVENLHLQEGKKIVALVKAPQIILVSDFGGYKLSARNQLPGEITLVRPGTVNAEVDTQLKGGEIMVATVTNDNVENLVLKKGQAVTAVFKAGAVILAAAR